MENFDSQAYFADNDETLGNDAAESGTDCLPVRNEQQIAGNIDAYSSQCNEVQLFQVSVSGEQRAEHIGQAQRQNAYHQIFVNFRRGLYVFVVEVHDFKAVEIGDGCQQKAVDEYQDKGGFENSPDILLLTEKVAEQRHQNH